MKNCYLLHHLLSSYCPLLSSRKPFAKSWFEIINAVSCLTNTTPNLLRIWRMQVSLSDDIVNERAWHFCCFWDRNLESETMSIINLGPLKNYPVLHAHIWRIPCVVRLKWHCSCIPIHKFNVYCLLSNLCQNHLTQYGC